MLAGLPNQTDLRWIQSDKLSDSSSCTRGSLTTPHAPEYGTTVSNTAEETQVGRKALVNVSVNVKSPELRVVQVAE